MRTFDKEFAAKQVGANVAKQFNFRESHNLQVESQPVEICVNENTKSRDKAHDAPTNNPKFSYISY